MAIKKRCIRCMKYLREDGTCQNPACVKYVPEPEVPAEQEKEKTAEDKKRRDNSRLFL